MSESDKSRYQTPAGRCGLSLCSSSVPVGVRAALGQSVAEGEGDGIGAAAGADLGVGIDEVALDGVDAEDEAGGDLLVAPAIGEQSQHLHLARREASGWRHPRWNGRRRSDSGNR